ncbi:MAG: SulP family inorganic anion transporter [Flavobacteriales bacterium]|nr:SulP family inorganic anion transporter [Flavobacteriales bacterium]MCB9196240.1 SulP family inorganic anion transporter [Flavobacteriales bacterium]
MKYQKASFSPGSDLPSSIVVFFVALPLCLGIAHGSEAPLMSGLIAGIVGGIIVGTISGSRFGVSGPAAGLMTIVAGAIATLGGSFETFLAAVVIAGFLQILLGVFKLGFIAYYFPNSVINGMLAGIGVTIFLKQIPHAIGDDRTDEGSEGFNLSHIWQDFIETFDAINYGAVIISVISLVILILFQQKFIAKNKLLKFVPGSMVAVVIAIILNFLFRGNGELELGQAHLVNLKNIDGPTDFFSNIRFPNFSAAFSSIHVWVTGGLIAIIASLETLLCVEATDKMDPSKNVTPSNLELIAQGTGNIVSGLIGGLPITQVIVRSSANINSGAKSKWSAVLHGALLFLCVLFIPSVLKLIPLSALAAVLLIVGFKLAHPKKFKEMYNQGWSQFIPFAVTVVLVWKLGLLNGVLIGLGLAFLFILYNNFAHSFYFKSDEHKEGEPYVIHLSEHMTFLNKASLIKVFKEIPNGSEVVIDMTNTLDVDADIWDVIESFETNAIERQIKCTVKCNLPRDKNESLAALLSTKKQKMMDSKLSLSTLMGRKVDENDNV